MGLKNKTDKNLLVLIVDYDPIQSKVAIQNLREKFPDVTFAVANDGQSALQTIQEKAPDLTLADLQMPGLNGFTLLRKVRQEQSTRDLPIMVLGGVRDYESVRLAVSLGADDFIAKPVDFHVLTRRINQVIKKKQRGLPLRQNHRSYKRRDISIDVEVEILVTGIHQKYITVFAPSNVAPGTGGLFNIGDLCSVLRIMPPDELKKSRVKRCVESQQGFLIDLSANTFPDRYVQEAERFAKIDGLASRVLGDPYNSVWIGLACQTKDISGGGLRLDAPWQFLESSILRVSLRRLFGKIGISSEDSVLNCIVRHAPKATGRHQIGLEFADLDPDIQAQIMRWCASDVELPE